MKLRNKEILSENDRFKIQTHTNPRKVQVIKKMAIDSVRQGQNIEAV